MNVNSKNSTETNDPITELEAIQRIEEQVSTFKNLLGEAAKTEEVEALRKELEVLKEGLDTLTSKQVMDQIEKINTQNQKLYEQVVKIQEEKAEELERSTPGKRSTKASFFTEAEVKSFVETLFPNGPKTDKVHKHVKIETKAAEQFGFNSIASGADINAITGAMVDPTLYQKRRKTNIIFDYFQIRTINVPTLIYLRKIEEGAAPDPENTGGAAWIACGQAKPMRSFRITTGEANAKKVAIFNTIDDCLLEDVPSFDRWIREDFIDEMREEINNGLLNGDPDVNPLQPTGLKKNAVLYSPTPAFNGTIQSATYIDAIFAIAARFAVSRERARAIFVSADVFYAIHALKGSDSRYLNNNLVYVNNLGQLFIAGVEVVPVDEEDVPSTHFLAIGNEVGFKIYAYGPMTIETGLNGTDFRDDKTSIRGYQRFLSFIPEDRENSVMYDTWANVLSSIEVEEVEPAG